MLHQLLKEPKVRMHSHEQQASMTLEDLLLKSHMRNSSSSLYYTILALLVKSQNRHCHTPRGQRIALPKSTRQGVSSARILATTVTWQVVHAYL